MAEIHHTLTIHAPTAKVYEALATAERIGTWWDKHSSTQTARGLVLEHDPGPEHGPVRLLVVASVPNQLVEWECISVHPATSPASAWTGTRFRFELEPLDRARATQLDFRQLGYDERSAFFAGKPSGLGRRARESEAGGQ